MRNDDAGKLDHAIWGPNEVRYQAALHSAAPPDLLSGAPSFASLITDLITSIRRMGWQAMGGAIVESEEVYRTEPADFFGKIARFRPLYLRPFVRRLIDGCMSSDVSLDARGSKKIRKTYAASNRPLRSIADRPHSHWQRADGIRNREETREAALTRRV
jgi:hypothetical protein